MSDVEVEVVIIAPPRPAPVPAVVIVANRVEVADHPPGTETSEEPCMTCGGATRIDATSRRQVANGLKVVCLPCAVANWPGMICGLDPESREPITLGEAVARGIIKVNN